MSEGSGEYFPESSIKIKIFLSGPTRLKLYTTQVIKKLK